MRRCSCWGYWIPFIFILSLLLGCGMGLLSLKYFPKKAAETSVAETSTAAIAPTVIVTSPETEIPLTFEERCYQEYLKNTETGEYGLSDLDGDGVQELLIGPYGFPNEIVTIRDGKAVQVLREYDLFLCEGGVIGKYSEGSGGSTYFFYRLENYEVVKIECLVWLFHDGKWYRSTDFSGEWNTLEEITEEERLQIAEKYACIGTDDAPGLYG